MAAQKNRVDGQPAYILHASPFRETSLIIEAFSRDWGRIGLVARGARRPRSALRGQLLQFQPLELAWSGGADLRTLVRVEWVGGQPLLTGRALLFGYYLNELLLKLLARDDPHVGLFESYRTALGQLASNTPSEETLRRFELRLVRELGYGFPLGQEVETGRPLSGSQMYAWVPERGLVHARDGGDAPIFSGTVLLALARDDFAASETLQQAKLLMRQVINHYLGGQMLHSRRVFMDLQEF